MIFISKVLYTAVVVLVLLYRSIIVLRLYVVNKFNPQEWKQPCDIIRIITYLRLDDNVDF